jgi:tyrosyl-tRNA synthetase
MKVNTDPKKIKEVLTRGVETIVKEGSLLKRLKSGEKLRIKHGVDPTGPNIHIGRAVSFWKLKDFQDLGHQVVLIIGDFTAQIGDASDKVSMRQPLTEKEIKGNLKDYLKQIGRILDLKKTEVHYNSKWLKKFKAEELTNLATNFTVYQMINRRNFKQRFEKKKPIGLHETLYPLYQGYDSVAIKADVEIGGFDQLFNFIVGRKVQEVYNQKPQDLVTFKLLYGLDGRKMSTSWGNVINIIDPPNEQYGKIMSMKDSLITNYFEMVTKTPLPEIKRIERELKTGKLNPRDAKAKLAREVVTIYYDKKEALKAEKEFERIFKERKIPSDILKISIKEKQLNILDLLVKTKLASSKSEAKRLVLQKGVRIDNQTQGDWRKLVKIKKGMILQAGKRRFAKLD